LGAGLDQVVTVFYQGAQGGDGRIDGGGVEPGGGQGGDAYRDRVGFVSFAAVPGRQHPDPGSEFGRYIHHIDAVGGQPLGQWGAQTGRAFDRPAAVSPPLSESSQLAVALRAHRDPNDVQRLQRGVDSGRGPRCLMRVNGDHDTIAKWCSSHGVFSSCAQ
jgi:hypothetical protein